MVLRIASLLALSALLTSAYCIPPDQQCNRRFKGLQQMTVNQLQSRQPTQALPANNNATLQYIGLGVGLQNYSCASTTSTPKSIGAIATLFDVTDYLRDCGNPKTSKLSRQYLKAYNREACQASQDLSDDSCQEAVNFMDFDVLGKHYFGKPNGAGVPFFDIYDQAFLSAQKIGDVTAPESAYDGGKNGFGAVDWLFLPEDGSNRSQGLSEVYRIHTAGGAPDPQGCSSGDAVLSYKYAAEYWFYS
ncbi:uncharacterized protein LTR77_006722 [Saxophila tyrrhenica]|uniref:Uncharacterized protein n=1 Tax=Saxophila tyrrhenica TaxID=1690608 RepID=A0AAV9P613_9PEZI|nr:hypothetical protein LTR77_006722 [Saxophila tyrrhenica]